MGLGPMDFIKDLFKSIRGWFRDNILNQTPTHGYKRVEPKKEERKVVYTERITVIPNIKFFLPDDGVSLPWGDTIIHRSGFDYSKFRHVKNYGLKFNVSEPNLTIYQGNKNIHNSIFMFEEFEVRNNRFLGKIYGSRIIVTFFGRHYLRPNYDAVIAEDAELAHQVFGEVLSLFVAFADRELYYQRTATLKGTAKYFDELKRAGIIE
jgi:hypothetical protein